MNEQIVQPCPICGQTKDVHLHDKSCHIGNHGLRMAWSCSCDHCCLDLTAPTAAEAVGRWNARSIPEDKVKRPDWIAIHGHQGYPKGDPQKLVSVTAHTAHLAMSAIQKSQQVEYYDNFAAAHRELSDACIEALEILANKTTREKSESRSTAPPDEPPTSSDDGVVATSTSKPEGAATDSPAAVQEAGAVERPINRDMLLNEANCFQNEQWRWVQQTFPDETTQGVLKHLREELIELEDAPTDPKELADCFLLLQCLASHAGISLMSAAVDKFEECKSRKWVKTAKGWRTDKPQVSAATVSREVLVKCVEALEHLHPHFSHKGCTICQVIKVALAELDRTKP